MQLDGGCDCCYSCLRAQLFHGVQLLPLACGDPPTRAPLPIQLVFLGHRLSQLLERRLARHDYNHTQAAIVMLLRRHPGQMAQDLAAGVKVEPPSVTRALQTLERRGLVRRQPHPTDGRASIFHLTERGQLAAAEIAAMLRGLGDELVSGVGPEELAVFQDALGAMLARVEEMRGAET